MEIVSKKKLRQHKKMKNELIFPVGMKMIAIKKNTNTFVFSPAVKMLFT